MTIIGHVADLIRYPVKSLRGHALAEVEIGARGFAGDRRWMIVDESGRFLTRREVPEMALFDLRADGDGLTFDHPSAGAHHVATPSADAPMLDARVWRDQLPVRAASPTTDAYLSAAFGRTVRLVFQHDASVRPIDPTYGARGDHVSLADGFPILITSIASLAALNDRLAHPIEMERFRPNIVVAGHEAWDEDGWRRIRIGTLTFRIAKPCSRCIITTQNPRTGLREHDNEPLTTLRGMGRVTKGGIMFGQNAIPDGPGMIAIGDDIRIL